MSAPVPSIPVVPTPWPRLPRTVWALGWTSFFADVSTEIIYPLLPIFLTVTLGTTVALVGLIEGVAGCAADVADAEFPRALLDRHGAESGGTALAPRNSTAEVGLIS